MRTNQEIIQSVLRYIEEHLNEPLTLDTVAAYTGYSPYHLHKMFTAICGLPLHAYVRRRQVSKGALLLVQSDLRIAEIASACGYLSQRAFHKAFFAAVSHNTGRLSEKEECLCAAGAVAASSAAGYQPYAYGYGSTALDTDTAGGLWCRYQTRLSCDW